MKSKLKELRLNKGLTLKELSNALKEKGINISPDSLAKYERGDRKPKMDKLIQLANFFDVSVPELQGYKNKNVPITKFEKLIKEKPNDDYTKSVVAESIRQGQNAIKKEEHEWYDKLNNKIANLDILELQIVVNFANFLNNVDNNNDDLINKIYFATAIINNLATNSYDKDKKTQVISELKKLSDDLIDSISSDKK